MSSPPQYEMYDTALLGILQHVGNIQDFLHVYFGFLYRKTDFYRLLSSPDDKMGFPPGVAEKMVLKVFKSFERMSELERERRLSQQHRLAEAPPPAVQELEVQSEPEASESSVEPAVPSEPATDHSQCEAAPAPPEEAAAAGSSDQTRYQAEPESYNGAVRENYCWSQDYTDVEVRVLVPKSVVRGRQVSVSLQPGSVRVCVQDGDQDRTLMEGDFTHRINTEDSLWSLEPGKCVVLSLNKTSEVWWNAVLKGEDEIDVNQINRERSMETVDEEEHAVLDRLNFDYAQKMQGKPQSHEMKVHEMLKKGWDAEGSPFKGQQFDPSMFDIPPGAVQF
ncbi:nudC domain-containing protein 3 [Synchiropus splendidus]|uniref:nudC domain-containing protein 3 n=1 Tax=Synchiropus splendidus TaxID=270530 RepID=UPI00237E817A|nr:nudC domain-containing protein 3 [Synchiropus splendidus]